MSTYDDLSKQFDLFQKVHLAGLSDISKTIGLQQKILGQLGNFKMPNQDVLDAITRMQTLAGPDQGTLAAIARTQDLFQSIQANQAKVAGMNDWPKLLEAVTRAGEAVTSARPFLDFYASHSDRLAQIARTQMQAAATAAAATSQTWVGVAALEADLEDLAGDAPTGQMLVVYRLIVWTIAVSLFMKLVNDGLLKGGTDEALLYAAAFGYWLEKAWHIYLADGK